MYDGKPQKDFEAGVVDFLHPPDWPQSRLNIVLGVSVEVFLQEISI